MAYTPLSLISPNLQWLPPPKGVFNRLPWSQGLTFGQPAFGTNMANVTAKQGWGCLLFAQVSASNAQLFPISGAIFNLQIQQPGSSTWQDFTTVPYVTSTNVLSGLFSTGNPFSVTNMAWNAYLIVSQTPLKWRCNIGVLSGNNRGTSFYVYTTTNTAYLSVIPSQYSAFSSNGEPGDSRYFRLQAGGYI